MLMLLLHSTLSLVGIAMAKKVKFKSNFYGFLNNSKIGRRHYHN